ncbi:hypothetical protein GGX14DRAFT_543374 [Mycena pura]|uniref:Uncharacterized protein n=1 Tax=Mycena pura TaxID=153505 RepID=A0AAD6VCH3_9AGAR|nr:hypothetical protein GGX14DRAFT_543374 [Mycena pura]
MPRSRVYASEPNRTLPVPKTDTRNISRNVPGQLPTYFAKRPQHEVLSRSLNKSSQSSLANTAQQNDAGRDAYNRRRMQDRPTLLRPHMRIVYVVDAPTFFARSLQSTTYQLLSSPTTTRAGTELLQSLKAMPPRWLTTCTSPIHMVHATRARVWRASRCLKRSAAANGSASRTSARTRTSRSSRCIASSAQAATSGSACAPTRRTARFTAMCPDADPDVLRRNGLANARPASSYARALEELARDPSPRRHTTRTRSPCNTRDSFGTSDASLTASALGRPRFRKTKRFHCLSTGPAGESQCAELRALGIARTRDLPHLVLGHTLPQMIPSQQGRDDAHMARPWAVMHLAHACAGAGVRGDGRGAVGCLSCVRRDRVDAALGAASAASSAGTGAGAGATRRTCERGRDAHYRAVPRARAEMTAIRGGQRESRRTERGLARRWEELDVDLVDLVAASTHF